MSASRAGAIAKYLSARDNLAGGFFCIGDNYIDPSRGGHMIGADAGEREELMSSIDVTHMSAEEYSRHDKKLALKDNIIIVAALMVVVCMAFLFYYL